MARWKIAGINFDHLHMGDLLAHGCNASGVRDRGHVR